MQHEYTIPRRSVGRDAAEFYLAQLVGWHGTAALAEATRTIGYAESWVIGRGQAYYESEYSELAAQRAIAQYHSSTGPLGRITDELIGWILPYTIGSILGEYRHAADKVAHEDWCHLGGTVPYAPKGAMSRKYMVCQPFSMHTKELDGMADVLRGIGECFTDCYWPHSFGGSAWANIVDHVLLYTSGKVPNDVWIDRSFDLQHNSGTYFDKLTSLEVYGLKPLLDAKRHTTDTELCHEISHYAYDLPSDLVCIAKRQGLLRAAADGGVAPGTYERTVRVYVDDGQEEEEYEREIA